MEFAPFLPLDIAMSKTTAIVVLSALLMANVVVHTMAQRNGVFEQLDLLVDLRHQLVTECVEPPDEKKMIDAAARAMVASIGDPYTVYLAPEEMAEFDKQVRGTFFGIGAEIDIHENFLRIATPLEDSPAWKAGILAGDIVLEVDGKTTEGITTTEAIKRLTGQEGTQVKLKVRHLDGKVAEITITRGRIIVPTVKGWTRKEDQHWDFMLDPKNKVGLVRVTQFTEDTVDKLRVALDDLKKAGMKGLIIDLRFDPGGLLDAAVQVSDMFMAGGKTIVSIRGRTQRDRTFESKTEDSDIKDMPLVVLVNESSASASEIVSGALKDNDRAIIIGTRSFGKGSVQQVKMLEANQGAIKVTNALYYLPSGRNIHKKEGSELWGVDPNDGYYVPMTIDQTLAMLKLWRDPSSKDKLPAEITPEWIEKEQADPQLAAALKAVVGKLTTNEWPRTGKSGGDSLARQGELDRLNKQREELSVRLEELNTKIGKLEKGEKLPAPGTPGAKDEKKLEEKKQDGKK
jgi:carboxyl-terminal processing protease